MSSSQENVTVHSHPDYLRIPHSKDSIADVAQKMTALAHAVRQGQSIAAATRYAASIKQETSPLSSAVTEMPPQEREAWSVFTEGKYPFPEIDWDSHHELAPTSLRPLRIAHRRAEALNRLYKTDKAHPGHSVWFTKHHIYHLPLVKAMARIIGAERNAVGGQYALNATEMADLQTINNVLSVSSEVMKHSKDKFYSAEIARAQQVLGSQREVLREKMARNGRKRKGVPE